MPGDWMMKRDRWRAWSSGPSDVEACCLEYPHPSYFWNGVIHYSTRDCLYETGGYYQDHYGDWNDQEPGLVGTTRAVNLEAIGENVTVESFYTFSCLGEDADELYYNGRIRVANGRIHRTVSRKTTGVGGFELCSLTMPMQYASWPKG